MYLGDLIVPFGADIDASPNWLVNALKVTALSSLGVTLWAISVLLWIYPLYYGYLRNPNSSSHGHRRPLALAILTIHVFFFGFGSLPSAGEWIGVPTGTEGVVGDIGNGAIAVLIGALVAFSGYLCTLVAPSVADNDPVFDGRNRAIVEYVQEFIDVSIVAGTAAPGEDVHSLQAKIEERTKRRNQSL